MNLLGTEFRQAILAELDAISNSLSYGGQRTYLESVRATLNATEFNFFIPEDKSTQCLRSVALRDALLKLCKLSVPTEGDTVKANSFDDDKGLGQSVYSNFYRNSAIESSTVRKAVLKVLSEPRFSETALLASDQVACDVAAKCLITPHYKENQNLDENKILRQFWFDQLKLRAEIDEVAIARAIYYSLALQKDPNKDAEQDPNYYIHAKLLEKIAKLKPTAPWQIEEAKAKRVKPELEKVRKVKVPSLALAQKQKEVEDKKLELRKQKAEAIKERYKLALLINKKILERREQFGHIAEEAASIANVKNGNANDVKADVVIANSSTQTADDVASITEVQNDVKVNIVNADVVTANSSTQTANPDTDADTMPPLSLITPALESNTFDTNYDAIPEWSDSPSFTNLPPLPSPQFGQKPYDSARGYSPLLTPVLSASKTLPLLKPVLGLDYNELVTDSPTYDNKIFDMHVGEDQITLKHIEVSQHQPQGSYLWLRRTQKSTSLIDAYKSVDTAQSQNQVSDKEDTKQRDANKSKIFRNF